MPPNVAVNIIEDNMYNIFFAFDTSAEAFYFFISPQQLFWAVVYSVIGCSALFVYWIWEHSRW